MNKLKLLLPLFILVFAGFKASTLTVQMITGIVTARSDGEPLPGVSVYSPLNKKGATTDVSGRYSLALDLEDKRIRFTYIGYKTISAEPKNNVLNVALEQDNHALEEVAVLGTSAKRISSSSVSYAAERLVASPSRTAYASAALEGRVAGVTIKAIDKTAFSPRRDQPQANQLTAGEWNDIDHREFWIDLMNTQEWSAQQSHWGFYTKRKNKCQPAEQSANTAK